MNLRAPFALSLLAAAVTASIPASAQSLDPLVVTATRAPRFASELPVAIDVLTAEQLAHSPALAIDDALKSSAAFSLFRRTGSLTANPTAQGVTLRNLGPNGAGRTLVLVDGVPLNDPFGGWVTWTKIPRLDLARAELVRGGGSSIWGSAALGGTIQLFSRAPDRLDPAHRMQIDAGDFGTIGGELSSRLDRGASTFRANLRSFHSDGFLRVAPADAGPIDQTTDLDWASLNLDWTHRTAARTNLGVSARIFTEDRGNGTPLQRNHTREAQLSARASGQRILFGTSADWNTSAYAQTQSFANVFTSVSANRTSETLALDQSAVPSNAAGASTSATWSHAHATTTLGSDARWVTGETQEYFLLNASTNTFTRERRAGGDQTIAGLFAHHDRAFSPHWRGSLAARLDGWALTHSHRRETDRATANVLRDDPIASRNGFAFSPRAGLVWHASDHWRWQAAAYRAFRVPTLNELHRPFRVGNVITEANPHLRPEVLTGLELGSTWTTDHTQLRFTAFANDLKDAVANVTLGTGPGVVPGVGFVPAGGLGRRRENLPLVRVRGIELTGTWHPTASLNLRADYLFSAATDAATHLDLPQVSHHTVVVGTDWKPTGNWSLQTQLRYVSAAFEDDLNTLILPAATTLDLRASHQLNPATQLFVAIENLFDAAVVAGRAPDGRADYAPPRFAHFGVQREW